ncbi:MAG TPA: TonB-dependent receptor [Rhizomicrobium sp.]|nr:TonB-dependent receptor [Rhizomicrobium sp.]
MNRSYLKAGAAIGLLAALIPAVSARADEAIETVTVTAKRLDDARNGIQTQVGASTYTITSQDIEVQPGGENNLLNQVILQAPGVTQDSFGQLHVRGDHNGLQYRLNGIILPEGISAFGQTLDPRLASSMKLITGALPAEYGLRTAGIIDIQTQSGAFQPGGQVSMYGGSHSELAPSFDYAGSTGSLNYFVSGDYMTNTLGIESPDGSVNPIHDRTNQYHGFAYLQDIIDPYSSVSLILGTSRDQFEIPNTPGLEPDLGLTVNGQTTLPSASLDERQREITHYAIASYLHSRGDFDFQVSGFTRYSSLDFTPDALGDLLYDGISQDAYKRDVSYGVQAEGAYHLGVDHTIRGGIIVQTDRATSETTSSVLPADCLGSGSLADPFSCAPLPSINPAYDKPISIIDNGSQTAWTYSAYIQDEWKVLPELTVNYGLRFDDYKAFSSGDQLSPRVNVVWTPTDDTTVHAGYSRYFTPPPFELVGAESVAKFVGTTATAPLLLNDTPQAERANYYDIGVSQLVGQFTLGVDTYYKTSENLIDEGQFGAPIILTPFNYKRGKQYGAEFTGTYNIENFQAYFNAALEHAEGKDITSSQFQFDPDDLAYIADNYIHLDHEQYLTMSGGTSYNWDGTTFSADVLYGSGLRKDGLVPNGDHVPGYTQVNFGVSHTFDIGGFTGLTARADIINAFDEKYEIRDGSGIGVGAPQWGPRRGFFFGLSKAI